MELLNELREDLENLIEQGIDPKTPVSKVIEYLKRIHVDNDDSKYYFWDETDADSVGPFDDFKAAVVGYEKYAEYLDKRKDY